MVWLLPLVSGITLLTLFTFLRDAARMRLVPRLGQPMDPGATGPFVSLLIPARNEERNIKRCLDGALTQSYPAYEVIVVDDGSTDGTAIILAEYAARFPRLRVVAGRSLPPGWAGKPNACQQAAEHARGTWLLFLDADTAPAPGLVAALVAHTESRQLDMLTIMPFLELGSFWERVIMPVFLALIAIIFPFERMSDDDIRPEDVLANGQCIFVRREAYAAINGHEAVRDEVLEDVHLAQALRRAGFRLGCAEGMSLLRVRMYTSGAEVVAGLLKNAAAGYRSSNRSMIAMLRLFIQAFVPLLLVATGLFLVMGQAEVPGWAIAAHGLLLFLVALSFWATLLRKMYALPWYYALLWPFGVLCYASIGAWGLWRVQSGQGVIWKGRTYAG